MRVLMRLDVSLTRLPRDKCAECRKRRVLYRITVYGTEFDNTFAPPIRSVARCAKCLGIGK